MTGVLDGVFVVEFAAGVAGPGAGQLLGAHGAQVVKIEPPWGDWSREMGSGPQAEQVSSVFLSANCNKLGMCLDLADPESLAIAKDLIARADVVLESFRPHVMPKLGLGYEQVAEINPSVVYASITGFGKDGPHSHLPSSDTVMQPYGGIMSIIGEEGGPPMRVGGVLVSDTLAANNMFASIILALYERQRTGNGSRVEVNLVDSIVSFQASALTDYLMTGQLPRRSGQRHPLANPAGAFRAQDGYIAFVVFERAWERFCDQLGLHELKADERFLTKSSRDAHRDELWDALEAILQDRSVDEWVTALRAADIPCAPVNNYAQLVDDPQVRYNGIIEPLTIDDREYKVVRPAVPGPRGLQPAMPPPDLGEQTEQILREVLHWSDRQIDQWTSRLPADHPNAALRASS